VVSDPALVTATAKALAPLERAEGESPYAIHSELQTIMNDLVGLIRRESEMKTALVEIDKLRARAAQVCAPGGRAYNPGWHLALDLRNMLVVAECVAQAALERQESRGGHTRDDYPGMSPEWRKLNLICSADDSGDGDDGRVSLRRQLMEPMRIDLLELFDVGELKKYMTEEELTGLSAAVSSNGSGEQSAAEEKPSEASEAPARKAGE
jgi:succinate dehydrogenase / fumarate reductase, flavoprotein subunit